MSTHAVALIPGNSSMFPSRYYQRYFYFSSHWIGYRLLKHEIIKIGFIALSLMFYLGTIYDKTSGNLQKLQARYNRSKRAVATYISKRLLKSRSTRT
jgi:hypothetical protein